MGSDFWLVIRWWATLFLVGAAAFPLTRRLFASPLPMWRTSYTSEVKSWWWDGGYFFSKAIGMAVVSWIVYAMGTLHLLPFSIASILFALGLVFFLGLVTNFQFKIFNFQSIFKFISNFKLKIKNSRKNILKRVSTLLLEELFFVVALFSWSWVKAHEPSIRGLEKFMDFGFMQSILNSRYFPPADMWYVGEPVNYYYFGHLVTAVLTKLSGIDLAYTFNLMLATIFALTLTMSFSIGRQLMRGMRNIGTIGEIGGGLLTSFLVTLAGNMQTLYAFTRGYTGDNVQPFWQLFWKTGEFWQKLPEGLNTYWYANATRFIPFTIHEFPSYSFVVSDVHGHVLSIPFVLLAIALLLRMFIGGDRPQSLDTKILGYEDTKRKKSATTLNISISQYLNILFYGFLVGVLLMTNALDGPIYLGLFITILGISNLPAGKAGFKFLISKWEEYGKTLLVVFIAAIVTSLPFLSHFDSFVNGFAVNCPPAFLQNVRFGPLIFETVDKCQRSPLWMMMLLWGFFIYNGFWLFFEKNTHTDRPTSAIERVVKVFFLFSLALIIFPEFFYFKDIYPAHFRSNTMFKLGYQAFILFSIVAGHTIVRVISDKKQVINKKFFVMLLIPQLFLVSIYPIFSVRSYFNSLRNYEGLNGLNWLAREYPDDYAAIKWLNLQRTTNNLQPDRFALVEADGDSYTDYERFSAFTGIPTVVGWAVHEWLWRGSYDVVSPRREVVRLIYESDDHDLTQELINQYGVQYVIVGSLERQKFTGLHEEKFSTLGQEVFRSGETVIYRMAGY